MRTTQSTEEARDAEISKVGEQLLNAWRVKLLAGDARAVSDLHNCVLDALAEDTAKQLFIDAATGKGGNGFNDLAVRVMRDECHADAVKQVERLEQRRADEAREQRIEQRVFGRLFAGVMA